MYLWSLFMCGLIGLFSYEVALWAILTMLVTLALGYPTSSWLVTLAIGYPTFACGWLVNLELKGGVNSAVSNFQP